MAIPHRVSAILTARSILKLCEFPQDQSGVLYTSDYILEMMKKKIENKCVIDFSALASIFGHNLC